MKLRNIVLGVATVLLEQREHMVVLIACMSLVQLPQGAVDSLPGGLLLVSVLHLGNRLATRI